MTIHKSICAIAFSMLIGLSFASIPFSEANAAVKKCKADYIFDPVFQKCVKDDDPGF